MFPKEHGAYSQLIFPLVTSLPVAGVTAPALLTALAAGAAFISHEPALVLLGRRGARAARETGRRAIIWWSVSTGAAVVAGGLALWLAPEGERWAFAYPAVPAAILAATFATNREKGAIGELSVAAAFSSLAIPICRVAGAPAAVAFAVALAFLGVFLAGTRGALPWAPLLAITPSWMVATTLVVHPPPPARLKQIGWTLMSASLAAALILVVTL